MPHSFNLNFWKAEVGGSLWVWGQPRGLQNSYTGRLCPQNKQQLSFWASANTIMIIIVCVCARTCAHMCVCLLSRSKDSFVESVLSLHLYMGSGIELRPSRFVTSAFFIHWAILPATESSTNNRFEFHLEVIETIWVCWSTAVFPEVETGGSEVQGQPGQQETLSQKQNKSQVQRDTPMIPALRRLRQRQRQKDWAP